MHRGNRVHNSPLISATVMQEKGEKKVKTLQLEL